LVREDRLLRVAFTGKTDHDAISDQLVVADSFNIDQIFQARGWKRGSEYEK
jgi:hypothetical protein